jgi:plasmid stabilization system protein ParE
MMPVEFHPDAEWELTEAQAWYRQRSDVAAQAFALEIDHALRSITEAPERWPKMQRGERRFLLARFPYSILYRGREGGRQDSASSHSSGDYGPSVTPRVARFPSQH